MEINKVKSKKSGLIFEVFLIIAALVLLGYFGLDLERILELPVVKKNFSYAGGAIRAIWGFLAAFIFTISDFILTVFQKIKSLF